MNISDKCVMMGGILNDSEEAEEQRDNDTEVVYGKQRLRDNFASCTVLHRQ